MRRLLPISTMRDSVARANHAIEDFSATNLVTAARNPLVVRMYDAGRFVDDRGSLAIMRLNGPREV